MQADELRIDKRQVRAAFDRAAVHYDEVAVLQREVADRMLERLDYIRVSPQRILDAGAGTGYCTKLICHRYPSARLEALDISHAMLCRARGGVTIWQRWRGRTGYTQGDTENLPYADASMDVVVSNLTLQWCTDLDATFSEFRRVLKPNGLLMFTSFGPDTLMELRTAWNAVDQFVHVNGFIDMHDVGDALLRAGFSDPVMDAERITVTYATVFKLMRELKQLGAHNVTAGRPRGLTGKQKLQKLQQAYELMRTDGVLPATHEVVYGHAWITPEQPGQDKGRVPVSVSLDSIR